MDGGRGLYIPFVPPESRRRNGCCRSIPPPAFLALQSGCPAVHPLSRASRDKRYNTLDFFHCVPKVVCQRGIGPRCNPHHIREQWCPKQEKSNTAPPLETPTIFGSCVATDCKSAVRPHAPKMGTALRFCTRRPVELLFVRDVLCDVLQSAIQRRT